MAENTKQMIHTTLTEWYRSVDRL